MRFRIAPLGLLLALLYFGCTNNPSGLSYDYLRSPSLFKVDTALTVHPYCQQPQSLPGGADCNSTRKYKASWIRPEDTVNFVGYRIYLDTTPPAAAGKPWSYVQGRAELASVIVSRTIPVDSIVFVFGKHGNTPDTLKPGQTPVLTLDSTGREDSLGVIVFALVPVYTEGSTPGQPQYQDLPTRDKEPPSLFHPDYKALAKEIDVGWERPTDLTSSFNLSQDTGLILKYDLSISPGGRITSERRQNFRPRIISYSIGGTDKTNLVIDSGLIDSTKDTYRFVLPDSNRSSKSAIATLLDSLHVRIGNISPLDTLVVSLFAVDSSRNSNEALMESVTLHSTDTTQPAKPVLHVDSTSIRQNAFTILWDASRDSIAAPDGHLIASANPNDNIMEYDLSRTLVRPAGQKASILDVLDTIIQVTPDNAGTSVFSVSMPFLPPGQMFSIKLHAVDRTGFESQTDSLLVSTKQVAFAGADSALVCPAGFIPIPRANLRLGDTSSAGQSDEKPPHLVSMGPYCIEPYEHLDSTGKRFVSDVTWDQADSICRSLAPGDSSMLCSEAEWERACEGSDPDSALLHGIQSEHNDPDILQASCNQATNDSAMAMSLDLRNGVCLTTEGVFDMAGNLSEWVRDPYVASAYTQPIPDTLLHGFAFKDSAGVSPHGIRGGNYLKTDFPQLSQTQNLARCSNRDFAAQVRPTYREDCRSKDKRKIAVIYGPGLSGYRCIDLPDSLQNANIDYLVAKDTTVVLLFKAGVATPIVDSILPVDTTFRGRKPIDAAFTTRSLAIVTFVNQKTGARIPDTLDATEMRDTSQYSLSKIFQREASNPDWSVAKDASGNYQIEFQYAYTVIGTKPAKAYYASRAIGFRCCSLGHLVQKHPLVKSR